MRKIISYSSICKKFEGNMEQALQGKFKEISKKNDTVYKNQNYSYHVKAVTELIGATFWVFSVTVL